jgi:hypothetical protein
MHEINIRSGGYYMLDNICNRLSQKGPGGAETVWPGPGDIFLSRLSAENLISENITPHFSLLPLAVVRCMSIQDRTIPI